MYYYNRFPSTQNNNKGRGFLNIKEDILKQEKNNRREGKGGGGGEGGEGGGDS